MHRIAIYLGNWWTFLLSNTGAMWGWNPHFIFDVMWQRNRGCSILAENDEVIYYFPFLRIPEQVILIKYLMKFITIF